MALDRSNMLVRRIVFLGAHALLPVVAYFGAVLPYQAWVADEQRAIGEKRAALARFEAVVSQEAAVRAFLQKVKDRNAGGELLESSNESAASAALQSRLKTAAESAALTVRSVRAVPNRSIADAPLIGARIEIAGPLEAIRDFVHGIENGQTLLAVTSAILRSQPTVQQAPVKQLPVIDAQIDVYGGLLPKEKS